MLLNGGKVLAERARISSRMEEWIDFDTGDRVGVLMSNTPLRFTARPPGGARGTAARAVSEAGTGVSPCAGAARLPYPPRPAPPGECYDRPSRTID